MLWAPLAEAVAFQQHLLQCKTFENTKDIKEKQRVKVE